MGPSVPKQQFRLPGIAGGQMYQKPAGAPSGVPARLQGVRMPGMAGGQFWQPPQQGLPPNMQDPLVRAMIRRRNFAGPGGQDGVSGASIGVPGAAPF